MQNDISILRDLTKRYLEICAEDVQVRRRNLWRKHNSLKPGRPLIYVRAFAWQEMKDAVPQCEDPFWHRYEDFLRQSIFRHRFDDDFIFEPWITVEAVYQTPVPAGDWEWGGLWGLPVKWTCSENNPRGARHWDPPLKEPEDFLKMKVPFHEIDEQATERKVKMVKEALGDLIAVNLDRAPAWRMWHADISTELAQLRGLEQIMWDILDRPDWLHKVLGFMRDGILKAHQEAEDSGDWSLCDHQNQSMPYAEELKDPAVDCYGISRKKLWYYCAAQELTLVGSQQFDEFMLQYQIPIMEKFGLTAYGCCEDLTGKIGLLGKIPNLRRIAVSPFANVERCAEQIGTDYVISYRPSPAEMVSYDLDTARIRGILRKDFAAMKGTRFDITLKDVETVQGDPQRIVKWVQIVREIIEEFM